MKANIRAFAKGATNSLIAFPTVGICVYDYIYHLKGLEYPSKEYIEVRTQCHIRCANRILFLATHCGGVYFKAGQYMGTLDKIAPKEYCD